MKHIGLLFISAAMLTGGLHAQPATSRSPPAAQSEATPISARMTEGEVRKVDLENKKITLKHGEIKDLEMPGMTMVFQVKDRALLDKVQAGDKVRFKAVREDGKLTVTELKAAK